MKIITMAVAGVAGLFILGFYIQTGLWLTSQGTPLWWMEGLGQWLAWIGTPVAITIVIVNGYSDA